MAKTLIVFSSKRGTTKCSAQMLKDQLTGGSDLHSLNEGGSVDLSEYDAVVIGVAINNRLRKASRKR